MTLLENLFIPVANAQTFGGAAENIKGSLNLVVPILFLVATIVFLAGVIMYISAGGKEDKIQKGKAYIIYGLIGLFVMVAVWGLVRIIISLVFGTSFLPSAPDLPCIPGISCNRGTSDSGGIFGNSTSDPFGPGGVFEGRPPSGFPEATEPNQEDEGFLEQNTIDCDESPGFQGCPPVDSGDGEVRDMITPD